MSDYGSTLIVTSNTNQNGTAITAHKEDMQIISIKARKKFKKTTNISIVTKSNIFYDIKCIYDEDRADAYYYIDPKGILKPTPTEDLQKQRIKEVEDVVVPTAKRKDSIAVTKIALYYADTLNYKEIAKKIYSQKTKRLKNRVTTIEKITLRLIGVYALQDKIYLKLKIYNDGTLPYLIDTWKWSVMNKGGILLKNPSEYTPIPQYECNSKITEVLPSENITKVFVFDQFALDTHQSLYIQLMEKALLRSPIIEVKNKHINNAFSIKEPNRIHYNLNYQSQ